MLKTIIAQKIKQLRKEKKLSQKYLARILECNNGFICQVEKGKSFYNLEHIEKICAALDYPVAKLFEEGVCLKEKEGAQASQETTDPMEKALVEVYRQLSSRQKGELLGTAEDLRHTEAQVSKKATAAQRQSGEKHPI